MRCATGVLQLYVSPWRVSVLLITESIGKFGMPICSRVETIWPFLVGKNDVQRVVFAFISFSLLLAMLATRSSSSKPLFSETFQVFVRNVLSFHFVVVWLFPLLPNPPDLQYHFLRFQSVSYPYKIYFKLLKWFIYYFLNILY